MVEIEKQSEAYKISETTSDGWVMNGSADKLQDGSISINFTISKPGELVQDIGSCNYYKPMEGMVSVNYNVTEADRDKFVSYVDTVIDSVLAKFEE